MSSMVKRYTNKIKIINTSIPGKRIKGEIVLLKKLFLGHKNLKKMKAILQLVGFVLLGLLVGSMVNMGILQGFQMIIPPPDDVDMNTSEGLKAAMAVLGPKHFIGPWLAHAIGTLSGSFVASKWGGSYPLIGAMIVGGFFLIGGSIMVGMVGGPLVFILLDLGVAYIPMAYLGYKLAGN